MPASCFRSFFHYFVSSSVFSPPCISCPAQSRGQRSMLGASMQYMRGQLFCNVWTKEKEVWHTCKEKHEQQCLLVCVCVCKRESLFNRAVQNCISSLFFCHTRPVSIQCMFCFRKEQGWLIKIQILLVFFNLWIRQSVGFSACLSALSV